MRSAAWGCVGTIMEATVGEFLIGILPRLSSDTRMPSWPPDRFGLCLALLKRSGAYAHVLRDWPPSTVGGLGTWTSGVRELGIKWRSTAQTGLSFAELAAGLLRALPGAAKGERSLRALSPRLAAPGKARSS